MLSGTDTFSVKPLDEGSARRREMHLRNNTQHSQETNIPAPARFVFTIAASEWPQTYAFRPRSRRDVSFHFSVKGIYFSFFLEWLKLY
jgi:hypothetical protein